MKNLLSLLALLLFSGTVFAAQYTWTAANLPQSLMGGTAYLVGVSTGDITKDDVQQYIADVGLTPPEDATYTVLGSETIVDSYGLASVDNITEYNITLSSDDSYFIVAFDKEMATFVVSDFDASGLDPTGGKSSIFGDYYSETPSDYWGNPMRVGPVPEPTALALLALGVAGVALRRRVR